MADPKAISHALKVPCSLDRLETKCGKRITSRSKGLLAMNPAAATCVPCAAVAQAELEVERMKRGPVPDELQKYYEWALGPDSGQSSKALVMAITGAHVTKEKTAPPWDPSDFGRCSRVLQQFPELRAELPKVAALSSTWAAYVEHWDELEALYAQDVEHVRQHGNKATAWRHANGIDPYVMYNRMCELRGETRKMEYQPKPRKPGEEARVPEPVCKTCNDTHRMTIFIECGCDSVVMCTHCPTPCQECRVGGNGAYCATTPCGCACHRPKPGRRSVEQVVREPTVDTLLNDFRALVHDAVIEALRVDGGGKSYDGRIEYHIEIPPAAEFEDGALPIHTLKLACYVIGPSRGYEWTGSDVDDVFARATADFEGWVREEIEENADG